MPPHVLTDPTEDDVKWLVAGLGDHRRWFVSQIFYWARGIAEVFFAPLLDCGIEVLEPSGCKPFVTACTGNFGPEKTFEYLYTVIENGSDDQKAGATWCLYWAVAPSAGTMRHDDARPELHPSDETRQALQRRERKLLLQTFLASDHHKLRNAILARISVKPEDYPPELHPLLREVISRSKKSKLRWLIDYRLSMSR